VTAWSVRQRLAGENVILKPQYPVKSRIEEGGASGILANHATWSTE